MNNISALRRKQLETGTLWSAARACANEARGKGVLPPHQTQYTMLRQNGIDFPICVSTTNDRGVATHRADTSEIDPALYIADLSDVHICMLEPDGISDHQMVIRRIGSGGRDKILDTKDLEAAARCLNEMDALVYFDSLTDGKAGRKRMQLLPLPLTPDLPVLPLEPIVREAVYHGPVGASPDLPFTHAIVRMPELMGKAARTNVLEQGYELILRYLGLRNMVGDLTGEYDILINRRWMMVAPRSKPAYDSIPFDALAFTGMLRVKDQQQAELMQSAGPLSVLRYIGRG